MKRASREGVWWPGSGGGVMVMTGKMTMTMAGLLVTLLCLPHAPATARVEGEYLWGCSGCSGRGRELLVTFPGYYHSGVICEGPMNLSSLICPRKLLTYSKKCTRDSRLLTQRVIVPFFSRCTFKTVSGERHITRGGYIPTSVRPAALMEGIY